MKPNQDSLEQLIHKLDTYVCVDSKAGALMKQAAEKLKQMDRMMNCLSHINYEYEMIIKNIEDD